MINHQSYFNALSQNGNCPLPLAQYLMLHSQFQDFHQKIPHLVVEEQHQVELLHSCWRPCFETNAGLDYGRRKYQHKFRSLTIFKQTARALPDQLFLL